jgi:hypothetical protein
MKKRRRRLRVAIVWWIDAHYHEAPETDLDWGLQVSAGLILERTKGRNGHIKLALITDAYDYGDPEPESRDVLTIPNGMVRHVEHVSVRYPGGSA